MYDIYYYANSKGRMPVKEYIDSLASKKQQSAGYKKRGNIAMSKNKHIGMTWDSHKAEMLEKGLVTAEELAESKARVAIMGELIKARNDNKISQRKLEELTGIRKSTIARMETGQNSPTLDTLLSVLAPLGKTLAVVPLKGNR